MVENDLIEIDLNEIDLNDFDKTKFILNGNKKSIIGPHKYMPKEYLEVGGQFYYFDIQPSIVRLITITHIRSGICFYTIEEENNEKEYWFPIDSFFSIMLEPKTYITNLNTKYNEFKSRWGKSEVIYVEDCGVDLWLKPYHEK